MDVDLGHLTKPCVCGREHTLTTQMVRIEPGAVSLLEEILVEYENPIFICDSNTRAAAEPFLEEEFKDYLVIELDPEGLQVEKEILDKVMSQVDACDRGLSSIGVDLLVAIGAGTIHDLARYVAGEYNIPFVSVPTAASMDGYASALMTYDPGGIEKSIPSVAPLWILADTNIFANAPWRLTAAGVSGLISSYTALTDWKIAEMVAGEYYCPVIAERQEETTERILRKLDEIRDGEPEAMEELMYALILSGMTTQLIDDGRAISGAEHHLSHLWEMEVLQPLPDTLYGERLCAATCIMLDCYKELVPALAGRHLKKDVVETRGLEMGLIENYFAEEALIEQVITENTPDPLDEIDVEDLLEEMEGIANIVRRLPNAGELREKLRRIGCKVTPAEIDLDESLIPLGLDLAPYVRNRITLLRLAKLLDHEE